MPLQPDEVLVVLRQHKAALAQRYGLRRLGVFGSVARDAANAESDVDIVFEATTPNLFNTVRLKHELETLLTCRVDVVRLREYMNPFCGSVFWQRPAMLEPSALQARLLSGLEALERIPRCFASIQTPVCKRLAELP